MTEDRIKTFLMQEFDIPAEELEDYLFEEDLRSEIVDDLKAYQKDCKSYVETNNIDKVLRYLKQFYDDSQQKSD